MITTYSSKINAFKLIARHLGLHDEVFKLDQLRKHSDVMELIGHPKNPRLFDIMDKAKMLFSKFRSQLEQVELTILTAVQSRSDLVTAREVAGICLSEQRDEEKLAELSSYLETKVQKEECEYKPGF
ncbi:hypothetical protein [Legionella bononiensis]|uniref:DNA helicase n=1 Tax=Legionella bononiensis TaxID=2793102 RepID=A0ABS1W9P5_9GAMM|nr:hypothetical protein [Legionella bononiensis]MBL7480719.1 hypothetical protein [Legionella bononiensis]MBL7526082.1 hypothetical protein [Legionella bononiensis]MBL7563423.1 hypothetical protein [Legionella bononiensis]